MAHTANNFETVLKKLGLGAKENTAEEALHAMPHSPDEAHDRVARHAFESRVKNILQPRPKNTNDHIFIVDFSELRVKAGDQWSTLSRQVHSRIHDQLEQKLITEDLYLQRDEVSYLVVVSGADVDLARLKIRTTFDRLLANVVPSSGDDALRIKEIKISWPNHIKLEPVPTQHDIIEGMLSAEDRRRKLVLSRDNESDSATILDDVRCIFRPMLSVRTRIISTYFCIPIKPKGGGAYVSGYDILGPHPSIDNIFELDSYIQDAAEIELRALSDSNRKSLLALPVHFETLASHRRQQYLARSSELFDQNTSRIVFELVGVPDHIPQSRMLEFTSSLKPHCRAIIARFPLSHGAFEAYRSVGLHAVGVDLYSPDKNEKTIFKNLEQFIEHAHQTQLKTYAHGIHSVSLYTAAVTAGFDYLDGYALSSVSDEAHDIAPFSLDMIYKDLNDKSSGRKIRSE